MFANNRRQESFMQTLRRLDKPVFSFKKHLERPLSTTSGASQKKSALFGCSAVLGWSSWKEGNAIAWPPRHCCSPMLLAVTTAILDIAPLLVPDFEGGPQKNEKCKFPSPACAGKPFCRGKPKCKLTFLRLWFWDDVRRNVAYTF